MPATPAETAEARAQVPEGFKPYASSRLDTLVYRDGEMPTATFDAERLARKLNLLAEDSDIASYPELSSAIIGVLESRQEQGQITAGIVLATKEKLAASQTRIFTDGKLAEIRAESQVAARRTDRHGNPYGAEEPEDRAF